LLSPPSSDRDKTKNKKRLANKKEGPKHKTMSSKTDEIGVLKPQVNPEQPRGVSSNPVNKKTQEKGMKAKPLTVERPRPDMNYGNKLRKSPMSIVPKVKRSLAPQEAIKEKRGNKKRLPEQLEKGKVEKSTGISKKIMRPTHKMDSHPDFNIKNDKEYRKLASRAASRMRERKNKKNDRSSSANYQNPNNNFNVLVRRPQFILE
jgi:hypothetical protein